MITIAIKTMDTSAQTIVRSRIIDKYEDFFGAGFFVIAHSLWKNNPLIRYKFSNSLNCTICFADAEGLRMVMALFIGSTMASRIRGS